MPIYRNQHDSWNFWLETIDGLHLDHAHVLMRSMFAPPSLRYVGAAIRRILDTPHGALPRELRDAARKIDAASGSIPFELRSSYFLEIEGTQGGNPVLGYAVTAFPPWGLLLVGTRSYRLWPAYRALTLHAVTRTLRFVHDSINEPTYREYLERWQLHHLFESKLPSSPIPHHGAIYQAELILRRLSDPRHDEAWTALGDEGRIDQHGHFVAPHGWGEKYPSTKDQIDACLHQIKLLPLPPRRKSKRKTKLGGRIEGPRKVAGGFIHPPGGGDDGGLIDLVPTPEIEDDDFPLDEFIPPARISSHQDPNAVDPTLPKSAIQIQTRWHLHARQAANQLLAWSPDWLTDAQISHLDGLARATCESQTAPNMSRYSAALWLSSLMTGQSRQTLLRHLRVMDHDSEVMQSWVDYIASSGCYRVANNSPVLAHRLPTRDDEAIKTTHFIRIPDIAGYGEFLGSFNAYKTILSANQQRQVEQGRDPFSQELISAGITPAKTMRTLPARVYDETADLASIALWAEWRPAHASTLTHYLSPRPDDVERPIVDAILGLPTVKKSGHEVGDRSGQKDRRIGSPHFPSQTEVRRLIQHYQELLAVTPSRELNEIKEYANAYTAYYYFFLAAALGYRTKIDPSPDIVRDGSKSVAIFADKDSEGYHRRIVVLPELFEQQYAHYVRHRRLIVNAFEDEMGEDSPNLIWFDGKGARPCRPIDVVKHAGPPWPYWVNALRRRMRTCLFERGADGEALDAWMGHWKMGNCPWMSGSGFTISALVKLARESLTDQLVDDGWAPIESKLTERLLW